MLAGDPVNFVAGSTVTVIHDVSVDGLREATAADLVRPAEVINHWQR